MSSAGQSHSSWGLHLQKVAYILPIHSADRGKIRTDNPVFPTLQYLPTGATQAGQSRRKVLRIYNRALGTETGEEKAQSAADSLVPTPTEKLGT